MHDLTMLGAILVIPLLVGAALHMLSITNTGSTVVKIFMAIID